MDIITTECQRRDKHRDQDDNKNRGKKRTFADKIQLKGGPEDKKKKSDNKCELAPHEQIDRRKTESRCSKGGRKKYQASDCEYGCVSQTPALKYNSNPNQEPRNKKARTDEGNLRIAELRSEEDSGNE